MKKECSSLAKELMRGAYDLHTHSSPSHFPRQLHDIELVREADQAGFAGVLIKNHYESTAGRAALINESCGFKTRAYGGLVLNHSVGGINPFAVESALRLGAAIIWMPTRDALNITATGGSGGDFLACEGIGITDSAGRLKKELHDIFDIIKHSGATLATGHLSPGEACLLCEAGIEAGVSMLLTHPDWARTKIDIETQAELAVKGVLIEKCWNNVTDGFTLGDTMASIEKIGYEHCILTTDRGQRSKELPREAMHMFVEALLKLGTSVASLEYMLKENPRRIVGSLKYA